MSTFLELATRIATELRRSNLVSDAKQAINDAIREASKNRFYLNEMRVTFDTVIGQEYYDDLGLIELDAAYILRGTARDDINVLSQLSMDRIVGGPVQGGTLEFIARYQGRLRLHPIPNAVYPVYVDGYGTLFPYPFEEADENTENEWFTEGESYIRALAKRNLLRDVVRDFGEARVWDATAEDYKQQLIEATTLKSSDNTLRSTEF